MKNNLTAIKAFIHHGPNKRIISTGLCMYLLEHGEASTRDMAEFFDINVNQVTYSITGLRRGGWVERIAMVSTTGLALDSRSGKLSTTSRTNGVYAPTDKLRRVYEVTI